MSEVAALAPQRNFPPPGVAGFDKAAYLGQWYEYSNVFELYEDLPCKWISLKSGCMGYNCACAVGGKCVRATYTDEGEEVGVQNEYVSVM
jgi:hypothetical protein